MGAFGGAGGVVVLEARGVPVARVEQAVRVVQAVLERS